MTRLLHTADWQLGCKLLQAGERASDVRAKRLEALDAVVDLAHQQDVDAVLVAGDTFEDHDVGDRTLRHAVRRLDELAPIPTYVLPGNHDPLVPGGVWDRSAWRSAADHVTLLTKPEPLEIEEDVRLYPCPLTQKRSTQDPTAWIPPREDDEVLRIGLAHGALDLLPESVNFPISANRAEQSDLDYLALGDWHGLMIDGRTAYPGTHEPTSYSEEDPGHALVVDLDAPGQRPEITPHTVRQLTWHSETATIQDPTDVDRLRDAIEAAGAADELLVRVRAEVTPTADEQALAAMEALREDLASSAFLLDWEVDVDAFHSQQPVELPEGPLTRVDDDLATILDGRIPDGPAQAVASEDAEVVRAARALLHQLARGDRS